MFLPRVGCVLFLLSVSSLLLSTQQLLLGSAATLNGKPQDDRSTMPESRSISLVSLPTSVKKHIFDFFLHHDEVDEKIKEEARKKRGESIANGGAQKPIANGALCSSSHNLAGAQELIAKHRLRQQQPLWRKEELLPWSAHLTELGKTLALPRAKNLAPQPHTPTQEDVKREEKQLDALVEIADTPKAVLRWWLLGTDVLRDGLLRKVPFLLRNKRMVRVRGTSQSSYFPGRNGGGGRPYRDLLFNHNAIPFLPQQKGRAAAARAKIALALGLHAAGQLMSGFLRSVFETTKWELVPEPVDVDRWSSEEEVRRCRNCPPKFLALKDDEWFTNVFLPLAKEWGSEFLANMRVGGDPRPLSWFFRMAIQVETFKPLWRYYPDSTHWTERPRPEWQCPVDQSESTLIPNLIRNMNPQLAVFVLWAVGRYFTGDHVPSSTGRWVNVFWGHWSTGALKKHDGGAHCHWGHADAISWVPGVQNIWATEGADLVQLLENSNNEASAAGALRLGQYVGWAHCLVSEGQTAGSVLRPLGIHLLQAALKALPKPKMAMVAVPVAMFPVVCSVGGWVGGLCGPGLVPVAVSGNWGAVPVSREQVLLCVLKIDLDKGLAIDGRSS